VSCERLFPSATLVHFKPDISICPECDETLKVLKTRVLKRAATLAIGDFVAHETVCFCSRCRRIYRSSELRRLIPEHGCFGYDIIVFVGESLFLRSRNYRQIRLALHERNIRICESEIAFLSRKFVVYLGMLHRSVQTKTRKHLQINGGYILHLDGTCDGASPHLISVLDGITEIVLDNSKMSSESAQELTPLLQNVKKAYGNPLAVVSDMDKGIAAAVGTVFPHAPAFICHFHFLRAVGKTLLGEEQQIIRERLRIHNVRVVLNRIRKRLEEALTAGGALTDVDALICGIERHALPSDTALDVLPTQAAYALISWALDAAGEGNGYGFPFDQTYLHFYQRIQELGTRLHQLFRIRLHGDWKENKVYSTISHDLHAVLNDGILREAAARMQEKVVVFNRLRTAMRITLPESKRGLKDSGEVSVNMKTIKKEVGTFTARLVKAKGYSQQHGYRKLVEQIETYGEKLFAHPIAVNTAAGTMLVQPQRTNNVLEQFFRRLMRTYRKKNGFASVEKVLMKMLPDTPLAMNLNNEEYLRILLAGKATLEQRFAEIDALEIRNRLGNTSTAQGSACPQMKKIIRLPDLPKTIVTLLQKAAS
jgi:uncharacterized protein YbaR (Trm112 family)